MMLYLMARDSASERDCNSAERTDYAETIKDGKDGRRIATLCARCSLHRKRIEANAGYERLDSSTGRRSAVLG